MSEKKQGLFSKIINATETVLDSYIEKAKSTNNEAIKQSPWDRKAILETDYATEQQYGWKERKSMVTPAVLKSMARRDSLIMAIIQTRINQILAFTQPQQNKYSAGFRIIPKEQADIPLEEKMKLLDPSLSEEEVKALKYELDVKKAKLFQQEKEDCEKITKFLLHCGSDPNEVNTEKRVDFDKFVRLLVWDRMVYNYSAVELIPTKDGSSVARFYPVSAGTIRLVTNRSAERYKKLVEDELLRRNQMAQSTGNPLKKYHIDENNSFKYVQVVNGRVVAAWTEKEMVFEPGNPSVDPEDQGYAPGELELLINLVTAHLFAEAHNRNFFTQGLGTKGILHIKGNNINSAQLEAFKRAWFNQVVSSKNAFRPPIIGIADDVKWVELAQSNKDMEFDSWMHYLIRMACAVYQIDPTEVNFDISKVNTSTLNESSNEARLKASRDKGLKVLLTYIESIVNNYIIRYWNKDLADKYEFRFFGFDAETRKQEMERLKNEVNVWKTFNEARVEMGYPPIENGDIVGNATYTQFLQMVKASEAAQQDSEAPQDAEQQSTEEFKSPEVADSNEELNRALDELEAELEKPEDSEDKDITKKSKPDIIEYYYKSEEDSNED